MTPASPPARGQDVLTEVDAVEVLAYLITAARTQLDEAAEYGPMRLLTAAQRLGERMTPRASAPVQELLAFLRTLNPTATLTADRVAYTARLDALCTVLAKCLLALDGDEPS
jgi:hypothetical protein